MRKKHALHFDFAYFFQTTQIIYHASSTSRFIYLKKYGELNFSVNDKRGEAGSLQAEKIDEQLSDLHISSESGGLVECGDIRCFDLS